MLWGGPLEVIVISSCAQDGDALAIIVKFRISAFSLFSVVGCLGDLYVLRRCTALPLCGSSWNLPQRALRGRTELITIPVEVTASARSVV